MKNFFICVFIVTTFLIYGQTSVIAEKEIIGKVNLGSENNGIAFFSSEEGFFSPNGPFVDAEARLFFFPTYSRDYLIQFFNGVFNQIPLTKNINDYDKLISPQYTFVSQQGSIVVPGNGLTFNYFDKSFRAGVFDWTNRKIRAFDYVLNPIPKGLQLESLSKNLMLSAEFLKDDNVLIRDIEETRAWLPTQPGGFTIGSDGLLYRNGMLWSAQIPKGGSYAYEYIGRLMSGHQVWVGCGVGSYIRYVTISNSARQIELILDIPWAPDPADDSRGFNPYNYGLGPWGELYCLIPPPPVDVTTYYTPQPGLPAELVVVRNHLKYFGRLNDGGVRLRKEPNTTSGIVGTYQNKTGFRIIEKGTKEETIGGKKNVWYKVRLLDGTEGWFFGSFVHNLYDGPNGNPPPWPNVPDW